MIEFGETLRKAREAKGYTTAQLAQKTHLMAQQIEALEREDFSRIAAPIYGRGFVKLYCEAVGLAPAPLAAEFMDIYSGNREPTIRFRRNPPPPPTPPAPPPGEPQREDAPGLHASIGPAPLPNAAPSEPSAAEASQPGPLFALESEIVPPQPAGPAESFAAGRPSAPDAWRTGRTASRYAPPMPPEDDAEGRGFRLPHVPRKVRRLLLLAGAAILVLWLAIAGCRAVWSSVNEPSVQEPAGETSDAPAGTPDVRKPPVRPSPGGLYID